MKKVLSSSAVLVVLILAFLAPAPPADAQSCIRCQNWWAWSNAEWGMGATCAAAEQNAFFNAYNWTYWACGVEGPCNWGAEEIVTACMWDGSQWKADARVQYKCAINMCM